MHHLVQILAGRQMLLCVEHGLDLLLRRSDPNEFDELL